MQSAANVHAFPANSRVSDPLVPPEADVRHFPYFKWPHKIMKCRSMLRGMSNPVLTHAFVHMVAAAMLETPAGSLPNDPLLLSYSAGLSMPEWDRIKEDVLQDWLLCGDERWHHPEVAEMAIESWQRSLFNKERAAKAARASQAAKAAARKAAKSGEPSSTHEAGLKPASSTHEAGLKPACSFPLHSSPFHSPPLHSDSHHAIDGEVQREHEPDDWNEMAEWDRLDRSGHFQQAA